MATSKTAKRKTPETKTQSASKSSSVKTTTPKDSTVSRLPVRSLLIALVIIVAILLVGAFKDQFIVAEVNGEPITRIQLLSTLEKKQGKTTLDNLVTEKLIQQEGKKKNINITDQDVKAEITNIEKGIVSQGQTLDAALAMQGMTRQDLTDQVKLQLILDKIVGKSTVTDKEVADFITKNQQTPPQGMDEATFKDQVKQQLEQQKTSEKVQKLVGDLQQKAKINYLLKL